ncbi:hypothetical protein [Pseudomonas sp. MAG733B]|uniref:hypothetical protein n=1 Tax=Pseudomonas sp. MAG733B TaxID=3122079 RepID=UPI0030D2A7D2
MPPVNATATASTSRTATIFNQATSQAKNRLSDASARNNQASSPFYAVPNQLASVDRHPRNPELPIPCPVYTGLPESKDLPDRLKKEGSISNQPSLEKAWSSLENRLRNGAVSEDDALAVLKSGILQTDTGKVLTPLFVKAMMRSIKPLDGLKPEQLREFVEIICHLPPERWANSFGENVKFPSGSTGEGVTGLIQSQLTLSIVVRDQKISAGELLDDDTWKAVRDFTQQMRTYVRISSDEELNDFLGQLEDFIHVRPSPQEAQSLIASSVEAMEEPRPNERKRWPKSFLEKAQKLSERLKAIEVVDTRPEPTGLGGVENSAVAVAYDFEFGIKAKSTTANKVQRPPQSQLLAEMDIIEKSSRFYNEVDIRGPVPPDSKWAMGTYLLHAASVLTALMPDMTIEKPSTLAPKRIGTQSKRPGTSFNPAYPTYNAAPLVKPNTGADSDFKISAGTQAPLHSGMGSIGPEIRILPESTFASSEKRQPATHSENTIGAGTSSATPPEPASALSTEASLTQWVHSVQDILHRIDNILRFPEAAAADIPLDDLQALLEKAEKGEPHAPPAGWWETIGPRIYETLSGMTALAGSYMTAAGSAAYRQATEHPFRTGTISVSTAALIAGSIALYNHLNQRYAGQAPNLPEPVLPNTTTETAETPTSEGPESTGPISTNAPADDLIPKESLALHQELIEDKIEEILDTPVAKGQPTLLTSILELMYQSTEHNLLADTQLLQNIETLLEQHSTKEPARTYAELIQEAEAQTHGPQDVAQSASPRVKRDAADAEARPLTGDVEQNASDMELTLYQFLATMDELRRPVIEVDDDIDTPVDAELRTAQDVVRLLRSRRSAGWTDASRSNGDRQLATSYAQALASFTDADASRTTLEVSVPTHSTFGQCWLNYASALRDPFFMDWAHAAGLDLSTVKVHPESNSISGQTERGRVGFTLNDTAWASVAGDILKAAKVISSTADSIPSPSGSRVPIALVAGFYAEQLPASRSEALRRSTELKNTPVFSATVPAELLEQRSEAAVEAQKQHIADVYTNHGLVLALNDLVKSKPDNEPVDLDSLAISAAPNSLFAAKYPIESRRMVSAHRYINAMGWIVPKTVADVRNLVDVLTTSIPESPKYGNFQGALSYPIPLKPADLDALDSEFKTFLAEVQARDFVKLLTTSPPEKGLELAIESDIGRELGKRLESKLNVITTQTSGADLLLAALLRFLDPAYGQQRNHVAGYHLTQEANWSAKPSEVISELEKHLIRTGKAGAGTAPALARVLLAGLAPEFLVKNLPDNLVCSSHTWVMLRIGVARIEQLAPGASAKMTFGQVMEYANTSAITVGQDIAVQMLTANPVIDWAIAHGVIARNANETYTQQQLEIALEKLQATREALARAKAYLSAPVPTRESLGLAELTRVFGAGLPFLDPCFRATGSPMPQFGYSLADLYITGKLAVGEWQSSNPQLSIDMVESKLRELKNVGDLFTKSFDEYFTQLRTGSESIFKYLVSQLPLEDRQSLEYGKQKYYSLRSEIDVAPGWKNKETLDNSKGRHGILIRSEFQEKVTWYEVFPSSAQIRKRDLTEPLKLGGKLKTSHDFFPPIKYQAATSQPFDWSAYNNGTAPRDGAVSNIIIDEIKPVR